MEPIIRLNGVCKDFRVLNRHEGLKGSLRDLFSRDYKTIHAVNNISMDIMPGEIVGYLGPNGAGKSTTIKMMTGVLEPSAGEILVQGRVPYKNRTQNAQEIGVVFGQRSQLWWALPLVESFRILKDMYQISDADYRSMIDFYETLVDLKELSGKPVRQMSLGQRTLSDILAAFLHNPGVVFLDEPTIGLDVSMKSKIRTLIKALNREKNTTVILTTHDMGDVDALCRRIVIIDKGTMLYDNDIEHLRKFFGAYRTMKLRLHNDGEATDADASELREILEKEHPNANLLVSLNEEWVDILINEDEIDTLTALNTVQRKRKIFDMQLRDISTEDVIKKIYEGGISE